MTEEMKSRQQPPNRQLVGTIAILQIPGAEAP